MTRSSARILATDPRDAGYGYLGPTTTAAKADSHVNYLLDNGLATMTPISWSDNTVAGAQIGDIIAYHWNHVGPDDDPNTEMSTTSRW